MENLIRIRGRLAWTLVVLAALSLVYQAIQLAWYLQESVNWYTTGDSGMAVSISWVFGWQGIDYALMLALVVATAACWLSPVVRRARAIALTAAWIATLTVALPWAVLVFSFLVSPSTALGTVAPWEWWLSLSLLHPLITSGVGVVVAIALWSLARRPPELVDDEDGPDPELEAAAESAEPDADGTEHPTVWKPSEATGTVWRTADEAAAGAPGARSLAAEKTESPGTEWALDAETSRPEPGPPDDWRPPATS